MSSLSARKPIRLYRLIAVFLLLAFLAQAAYFCARTPLSAPEAERVSTGLDFLHGRVETRVAMSRSFVSPMIALASASGFWMHSPSMLRTADRMNRQRGFIRAPFLLAGLCLGISLFYVTRRLFGPIAGNVALAFYVLSPTVVAYAAQARPEIFAAWGAFGLIFAAIATAHTLYAPREAILWNWRRILVLAAAITIATGAGWPFLWLLLPAAAMMMWAVPHRRRAALAILAAALGLALVALDAMCLADTRTLLHAIVNAGSLPWSARTTILARASGEFFWHPAPGATLLGFLLTLGVWCVWPRARYFSNTAPLLVFGFLLLCGVFFTEQGVDVLLFTALPFLYVFLAGISTDLRESRWRVPTWCVLAVIFAVKISNCIAELVRLHASATL